MEELVEGAWLVVGECLTIHEAVLTIERQRWFERRAASSFEAQTGQSTQLGLGRDVVQQQSGHAPAEMIRMGSHGLSLATAFAQLLQSADSDHLVTLPDGPDGDA